MRLGIFAKTFGTVGAAATLEAVARAGYSTAQFNMASLGLPSMPGRDPSRRSAQHRSEGPEHRRIDRGGFWHRQHDPSERGDTPVGHVPAEGPRCGLQSDWNEANHPLHRHARP